MSADISRNYERDRMAFSTMIWFTNGNGLVTAAFIDVAEARSWAARHDGQMVHFSNGSQLGASFALKENYGWWLHRLEQGQVALAKCQASQETGA